MQKEGGDDMTPEQRADWVRQMGARDEWWALDVEQVVEPDREIIDPHCHLWVERDVPDPAVPDKMLRTSRFMPDDLCRVLGSGHRVAAIIYIECGSGFYSTGEPHLRPVGESEFAMTAAAHLKQSPGAPSLAAVSAFADLRDPALDQVIDAHVQASNGHVRAFRQSGARLKNPAARLLAGAAEPGLYADPGFRRGLARLGERGFLFEAFQFHFQLGELADLAAAVPGTTVIVNHLGAPVGYGRGQKADQRVFTDWSRGINRLSDLPNVVMKLGGMASPVTEYDGALRPRPPSSDDFITERGRYFHTAIRKFGAGRCMFESNFPVDSVSISYLTLWNAYKKMAADYSRADGDALLSGTARQIYRI